MSWPILDPVSAPQLPVTALALAATFLAMPRRDRSGRAVAGLVAAAVAHLLLVATEPGLVAGLLWTVGCGLPLVVLPGAARRLAAPYLGLAAVLGLVGSAIGGGVGAALLLAAVAVRMGLFPFHGWAVGAYTLAPTALAVPVVAPMSGLALVARAPLGLESPWLVGALALSAATSTALALVQRELARAVGFLTVAVEGIVLVGVLDGDSVGHTGGLMMWGATALALTGLGHVAACLRSRRGPVPLDRYLGLSAEAPVFAGLFLLFGLSAVGAPGTADFVSEDLVLHGTVAGEPLALAALVAVVSLQAYAALHLFYRVFLGPPDPDGLPDVLPRERVALLALAALLVVTGLFPQLLVTAPPT